MQLELNQQKVLELLLKEIFLKERVEKYGASVAFIRDSQQDWFNWLYEKELVSKEHLDIQLSLLNKE